MRDQLVHERQHSGNLVDEVNGVEILDCRICGFKHILPLPTQDQLTTLYRDEYYSVDKPKYLERHREDLDWWNLVYDERLDILERLSHTANRRILDVGSGPGFFLLRAVHRGWEALGIEPSSVAVEHSRSLGVDVIHDFLTPDSAARLGRFNVVHLSEVLEHIPDPIAVVETAFDLLEPGGLLCVVVPNDYNPFQKALRSTRGFPAWWIVPNHHMNYFDFQSIQRVLTRVGFLVEECEATFPIDWFLLMGEQYVDDPAVGRQCHKRRMLFERTMAEAELTALKREMYRSFARLGIGREAQVIARKPAAAPAGLELE